MARYLRDVKGWVRARASEPNAGGRDMLGVPGYSIECKARRRLAMHGRHPPNGATTTDPATGSR